MYSQLIMLGQWRAIYEIGNKQPLPHRVYPRYTGLACRHITQPKAAAHFALNSTQPARSLDLIGNISWTQFLSDATWSLGVRESGGGKTLEEDDDDDEPEYILQISPMVPLSQFGWASCLSNHVLLDLG